MAVFTASPTKPGFDCHVPSPIAGMYWPVFSLKRGMSAPLPMSAAAEEEYLTRQVRVPTQYYNTLASHKQTRNFSL
jgi:hypothetical protein